MPSGQRGGRRSIPPFRRSVLFALVIAGLGLASPVRAQQLEPGAEPMPPRPMELLLEHGASLGLTPGQLERLAGIRERLATANEPLVNRMLTLRRQWQRQRGPAGQDRGAQRLAQLERIRAAAEPTHERIQRNNRTAMQAVNRLLTPEQRAHLRAIVEDRRARDVSAPAANDGSSDAGGND